MWPFKKVIIEESPIKKIKYYNARAVCNNCLVQQWKILPFGTPIPPDETEVVNDELNDNVCKLCGVAGLVWYEYGWRKQERKEEKRRLKNSHSVSVSTPSSSLGMFGVD